MISPKSLGLVHKRVTHWWRKAANRRNARGRMQKHFAVRLKRTRGCGSQIGINGLVSTLFNSF